MEGGTEEGRRRRSDVIKMSVIKAAVMSWRIKEQKMEHQTILDRRLMEEDDEDEGGTPENEPLINLEQLLTVEVPHLQHT